MIEVYPNLFVGDQSDCESIMPQLDGWAVVHACKEPYHRQALGYVGKAAAKNHPEYLVARRGLRLILNMVDVDNPAFFDMGMIRQALDFIDEHRRGGLKVLVHCNLGESRAPSIALLYLAARLKALPVEALDLAEARFRTLYPDYNPKPGIREHLRQNWQEYCRGSAL
jgi:predicted protein tyrosine phosphatase